MTVAMPRVGIILLNWNGWRDTIECLDSLCRLHHRNFFVVVVDNGSADDSVERITQWAREFRCAPPDGESASFHSLSHDGKSATLCLAAGDEKALRDEVASGSGSVILVRSAENLGFAAGCNLGMRLSVTIGSDYLWLLNNDTVVDPESLGKLVSFLEEHPDFAAATGQIRHHRKPDITWNCGGNLLPLGFRRYNYRGAAVRDVPQSGHSQITFMTGCAALLRAPLMERIGFLSERFFFGEEDFELCHRLKRLGHPMACCYDAVIFHKVGASISAASEQRTLSKIHIYYLNRFVHMRTYWSYAFWQCWRYSYCAYIVLLLRKSHGTPFQTSLKMLRSVLRESSRLDKVDRETFGCVMKQVYDA